MNIRLTILIIILISGMGLASCAAPAAHPVTLQATATNPPATQAPAAEQASAPPAPTQPAASQANSKTNSEIVLDMVERLNAGDVDGSLAYFSDDALSYFIGMPPTGIEFYRGGEALRPTWEYCVSDHFEWQLEITRVENDLVFAKAKTWLDFTKQLGVAPNEFDEVYQVQDGKIMTYGSTMTKEALARFKPAFYEVMPPEPTAVPESYTPASEITVTIADGTCATGSLAALKAGDVTVRLNVEDQEKSLYALSLFTLEAGKDMLDLMSSTAGLGPPSWADTLFLKELGPGESESYTVTLEESPVYLICWSQPPALPIGNAGPILVVP